MTTYSLIFTKIKNETLKETRKLIKGFYQLSDTEKQARVETWLYEVSQIYEMQTPHFTYTDDEFMYEFSGGGQYSPSKNHIAIFKWSVVTLLHEFRHAMQSQLHVSLFHGDIEEDARAWSVSLFRKCAPKSYEKAVESGKLRFH